MQTIAKWFKWILGAIGILVPIIGYFIGRSHGTKAANRTNDETAHGISVAIDQADRRAELRGDEQQKKIDDAYAAAQKNAGSDLEEILQRVRDRKR